MNEELEKIRGSSRVIKFRAWNKCIKSMSDEFTFEDFDGSYFIPEGWEIANMEIMQFTGLLDKNGKEIYESDIVKYGNDKPDEVIYNNGGFIMSRFYHRQPNNWKILLDKLEIIGNIYENPDLLQTNK